MYSSIQRVHRKKQFFVLKFLWRGQVIICKNRKLIWCDLIPMNLITNPLSLNWSNFFAGAYLDDPAKRDTRFGLLKVFLTVITGLSIGAWVSQKMAAFLEENELFGEAHHIISRFLNLQIYEFFLWFFFQQVFRSSHFSFLVFGHFWRRSYENTKILCNLCLHFARQDGQDEKKPEWKSCN